MGKGKGIDRADDHNDNSDDQTTGQANEKWISKSTRLYLRMTLFFAGFVGFAILVAFAWQVGLHRQTRKPASAIRDANGEIVFWDDSLSDLEREGRDRRFQGNALGVQSKDAFSISKNSVTAAAVERRTGVKTKRSRRAVFNLAAFVNAVKAPGHIVHLNLFEDVSLKARMVVPSAYGTNAGVYAGSIDEDPNGRVHFYLTTQNFNGVVDVFGRRFRIVESGEGDVFIIEESL